MRRYKLELEKKLNASGWELEETDSETEWWLEEVWTITSTKQNWGYKLYLHFLVDLQYLGDIKGSAVWCVNALEGRAENYVTAGQASISLCLRSGIFSKNAAKFIEKINSQRINK